MSARLAVLAVTLGGCDIVVGLEHVGPPGSGVDAAQDTAPSGCLVERFDDGVIDPTRWDVVSPGNATVMLSEENNGLVARITPGQNAYNGIASKQTFDMVGGSLEIMVTPAYMGGFVETIVTLDVSSLAQFIVSAGAGNFNLKWVINSIPTSMYIPYTADMKIWRIEHRASTQQIVVQTSTDGTIWTDRLSAMTPYTPTTAKVELLAGEYNTGLPVATSARWEALRVISAECP